MPDRGEHRGAQRIDRLHLGKVADDRRWLFGQLLEDGPLDLWGGGEVEPAGQSQHRVPLVAGPLDSHCSLPSPPQTGQPSHPGGRLPSWDRLPGAFSACHGLHLVTPGSP
jgi:hypothetical protein